MSDVRIHAALAPRVAILASPDVDDIAGLNHLANLAELLRPFEGASLNIKVRTSQLETRQCPVFHVRFDPLSSFSVGSSPAQRPEELLDAVGAHLTANAKSWQAANATTSDDQSLPTGDSPWFADFRDMILDNRPVNKHEAFSHPAAILLAVSTNSPDPMNAFAQLYETSCRSDAFASRPYMDPNVLKYYVLLHDVSRHGKDLADSVALLDLVKKTYGLHCCILPINSHEGSSTPKSANFASMWARALHVDPRQPMRRPNIGTPLKELTSLIAPGSTADVDGPKGEDSLRATPTAPSRWRTPGPETDSGPTSETQDAVQQETKTDYGAKLSDDDVGRLKSFVRELTAQSLIPFMERCVTQWNEQLAASRRGITSRIFGAGRKFFASGKSGSTSEAPSYDITQSIYPHNSLEAQTRRLADFAFVTRDYTLAASMYELCRKDFSNDRATLYWAGATEMLGLSHLLSLSSIQQPNAEIDAFLSQACQEYVAHGLGLEAIRATLLHCDGYRQSEGIFRYAPAALTRAAGSAEEVFGALLLERAAECDLQLQPPALRKSAMHLTMAAHRYEECGQKLLSLRCYDRAASFYRPRAWSLLADHVEYALGRQARIEGNTEKAAAHFASLLRRDSTGSAPHASYLDDFLEVLRFLSKSSEEEDIELPTLFFDAQRSRVQVPGGADAIYGDDAVWESLEKTFIARGFSGGGISIARRKPLSLARSGEESTAGTNETITVEIMAVNPLNTPVTLTGVRPILGASSQVSVSPVDGVSATTLQELHLEPLEARLLSFSLSSATLGAFRVESVAYSLAGAVAIRQPLIKRGRRLNTTKAQRIEHSYAEDLSLVIKFVEPRPALNVHIVTDSPKPDQGLERVGVGEEQNIRIKVSNVGGAMLRDLRLLIDRTETMHVRSDGARSMSGDLVVLANDLSPQPPVDIHLADDRMNPGESVEVKLSIRGAVPGLNVARCLFVFQSASHEYFTARWAHSFVVEQSLDVAAHCNPSKARLQTYLISLEAANLLSAGSPLSIDSVSFVSPRWIAADNGEQPAAFDPVEPLQVSNAVLALTASPRDASDIAQSSGVMPMSNMDYTVNQLRAVLLGRDVDRSTRPPPTCLLQSRISVADPGPTPNMTALPPLTAFYRELRLAWRRTQLTARFGTLKAEDIDHVFSLYEPHDLDIVIHWSCPGTTPDAARRNGQVAIFGLKLGPAHSSLRDLTQSSSGAIIRSMYAETANEKAALLSSLLASRLNSEQDPLMVDARVPRRVLHDFEMGPVRQKVNFVIQNLSPVRAVAFVIQLHSSSTSPRRTQDPSRIAPYVGRLTLRGHLPPLGSTRCTSHALITHAGAVELGGWTLQTVLHDPSVVASSSASAAPLAIFDSSMATAGKMIQAVSPSRKVGLSANTRGADVTLLAT